MKRVLLALSLFVCSASVVEAQLLDSSAALKAYAAKSLPRCPGSSLTLERSGAGPTGLETYVVTLRSTDQYCGTQKYLLYSPRSRQVLMGAVVPLPKDGRDTATRIAETTTKLLGKKVAVTIAPFPLPDGLKTVKMTQSTPYGPFAYTGFVDSSEQFLIVATRSTLAVDPGRFLRENLGAATGARRGAANAAVEVIEVSDFQCPTCAAAHEKIEPIVRKNLSKMQYIRIDLPLFEHHDWAIQSAMGARAIQRVAPAKYWDYVDYIFKNQQTLTAKTIDATIKDWVEDNDISWAAVQKIYTSKPERDALLDQVSRAFTAGIAATPTFIVNGQIVAFGPEGTYTIAAINEAIATAAKKPAAAKPAARPAAKPAAKKQ